MIVGFDSKAASQVLLKAILKNFKGKAFVLHLICKIRTNLSCLHLEKAFLDTLCKKLLYRSSHRRSSVRKDVLRNFAKFTGKHMCQSLFFNKVAGQRPTRPTWATMFKIQSQKKLTGQSTEIKQKLQGLKSFDIWVIFSCYGQSLTSGKDTGH